MFRLVPASEKGTLVLSLRCGPSGLTTAGLSRTSCRLRQPPGLRKSILRSSVLQMVDTGSHHDEDFAALFAESLLQENAKEGEILRGTVISVGKDYAIVDIGYKSEGQVPLEEFRGADGTIQV